MLPKFHPLTDHEAPDLAALPHGEKPHTHCPENVCAPGTVWTGPENLLPTPGFLPQTIQPIASRFTRHEGEQGEESYGSISSALDGC
jgi:hypothetical protein